MAHKEEAKSKQRVLSKQAATRKVLEDQLADIQREKDAAREQKKREAAELKKSIRQYEEEEVQRWHQHKEQQAKTKQMYSQQVYSLSCPLQLLTHAAPCLQLPPTITLCSPSPPLLQAPPYFYCQLLQEPPAKLCILMASCICFC